MARHRAHRDPDEEAWEDDGPTEEAPGSREYKPTGRRGPVSECDAAVIVAVAKALARGCTRRQAAALAGVRPNTLNTWVKRGHEETEEGKETILTALAFEVDRAEAHYQDELLRIGNLSSVDKRISDKFVRWRLAVGAPKEFTIPATAVGTAAQGLGPAFELVTPEEAVGFLTEKLERFLAEHEKNAAALALPEAEDG